MSYQFTVNSDYIFTPQTPGGSLSAGSNTITLSPVPLGINGTDVHHYVYISSGTGTPEACLITGGTAVSGAASGTIVVTCAYTHTGAWTVSTATSGVQECLQDQHTCVISQGSWQIFAPIFANVASQANCSLLGLGPQVSVLYRAAGYQDDIILFDETANGGLGMTLKDFTIENGGIPVFNNTAGNAINIKQNTQVSSRIYNVRIHNGYNGLNLAGTGNVVGLIVDGLEYVQDGSYAASYASNAAIICGSSSASVADTILSNIRIWCDLTQSNPLVFGVVLNGVDGLNICNSAKLNAQVGLYFNASSRSLTNIYAVNLTLDGFSNRGMLFSGSHTISNVSILGGAITGYHGQAGAAGIEFDNTTSGIVAVGFSGVIISGATNFGLWYRTPSTGARVNFSDNICLNNGDGATGYGIFMSGYGLTLEGNNCFDSGTGVQSQNYGIGSTGTVTGALITNNNVNGNVTAAMIVSGTTFSGTSQIMNNPGYNPLGPSAITVGASPFTYTAGVSPEIVYISGGTLSAVKLGGTTVATSSPAQVALAPNQAVQITYSVAPTMVTDV